MTNFADLFPALVECFVIILFGYISGRLNIVTPSQGKGIGSFVGTFALPALLFKSMVELNFSTVSWSFMVAVLLAKTLVFIVVFLFSVLLVKPRCLGRGSLYAIFTTQSNDFALGYPLIQALYGASHPEFLQYIYLLAPISLLILNPIGFLLLEIDKVRNAQSGFTVLTNEIPTPSRRTEPETDSDNDGPVVNEANLGSVAGVENEGLDGPKFNRWTCFNIFKGVILNPLVFMVFIGLIGHFAFKGVLPELLNDTLTTLANAFSGAALFYLGLSMVGKISQQSGIGLIIPASLIAAKIVLLPIVIRELVLPLSEVIAVYKPGDYPRNSTNMTEYKQTLADFGYLYGTFPTAPTVVIYASKYGVEVDRLATGMVLCTSLSAPIMYISAWTLSMSRMSSDFFHKDVREVDKDISIISLFCSVWCLVIFILGRKFLSVPHAITLGYIVSLIFMSLGTILCYCITFTHEDGMAKAVVFGMMFFGVQSSRLLTASLALSLVGVLTYGQRWLWKFCFIFVAVPFILSFFTTVVLMSSTKLKDSIVFEYGQPQFITSFVIILTSLVLTIVSLFIIIKMHGYRDERDNRNTTSNDTDAYTFLENMNATFDSSSTDDEDDHFGIMRQRKCCLIIKTRHSFLPVQKGRHIVLLLLLVLSMFIGLFLTSWKMSDMEQVGIFFEISFLDSVFNFGQGFFVFCVFGLDADLVIDPFIRMWRKLRFGSEDISLPSLSTVDREILLRCLQFTRHHMEDCIADIVRDRITGLSTHREVFSGKDLCTWLVERGLVNDRQEACIYGQNLMFGHVLYHHKHKRYFHDQQYFYKFETPKSCLKVERVTASESHTSADLSSSLARPSSSAVEAKSPRRNIPSPSRKWFRGFSFEAYVVSSDADSYHSPRRRMMTSRHSNKDDHINETANNNRNCTDTSEGDAAHVSRPRKKKLTPKYQKNLKENKNRHQSSDSSF